jgi:acetyl-CoA carboxylase carboxyl transferase subunit alpha
MGIIDEVIPEPLGGAHRDPQKTALNIKDALQRNLKELKNYSPQDLLKERYNKFRKMGVVEE